MNRSKGERKTEALKMKRSTEGDLRGVVISTPRWKLATRFQRGRAMGVQEMHKYGVPRNDWCKFGIYNATCR